MFEALRALVLDLNRTLQPRAVDVTVTVPDGAPVDTRGIWITPETVALPATAELLRRESVAVMALGRDALPAVPRGSIVLAPTIEGGEVLRWRVDGLDVDDPEKTHVVLVPDPEPAS